MNVMQQLLTKHIDIWTAAETEKKSGRGRAAGNAGSVYGIKKLRELILELAVRGKLVPQDANDEPASKLLNRIQDEKAELITNGKIKKNKSLPLIKEEEKLFELPQGWAWARLGDTGQIFNGNSINENEKLEKFTKLKAGWPFIATKDVGYGRHRLNYKNGVLIPFENHNFKIAHKEAVLICSEGGSAGRKIGITDVDICFGNKLYANEVWPGIAPLFIFYVYQSISFYESFSERMTGIIGGVSIHEFLNILVPIPPSKEQNRIVAKVDELMTLCDQLEAQHANAAEAHEKLVSHLLSTLTLSQSAEDFSANWQRIAAHFDTLFTTEASIDALNQTILELAVRGKLVPQDASDEPAGELFKRIQREKIRLITDGKIKKEKPLSIVTKDEHPFALPSVWEWARIGQITKGTDYGLSEKTFDISSGIPVLKMGDIQGGKIILGGQKCLGKEVDGLPELYLIHGDLLYNRTNSEDLVGKTGIYEGSDNKYTFASYLIRIRCIEGLFSSRYLNLVMNAPFFRQTQIVPHLKKQCGQANVNGTIMKNMLVSVPPLVEQERIVTKVDELLAMSDQLKSRITDVSQLQKKLADVLVEKAIC